MTVVGVDIISPHRFFWSVLPPCALFSVKVAVLHDVASSVGAIENLVDDTLCIDRGTHRHSEGEGLYGDKLHSAAVGEERIHDTDQKVDIFRVLDVAGCGVDPEVSSTIRKHQVGFEVDLATDRAVEVVRQVNLHLLLNLDDSLGVRNNF
jgi:hypothetical protein